MGNDTVISLVFFRNQPGFVLMIMSERKHSTQACIYCTVRDKSNVQSLE